MPAGFDLGAFMAGTGIAWVVMATVWVALYALATLRKLLSVSGQ